MMQKVAQLLLSSEIEQFYRRHTKILTKFGKFIENYIRIYDENHKGLVRNLNEFIKFR